MSLPCVILMIVALLVCILEWTAPTAVNERALLGLVEIGTPRRTWDKVKEHQARLNVPFTSTPVETLTTIRDGWKIKHDNLLTSLALTDGNAASVNMRALVEAQVDQMQDLINIHQRWLSITPSSGDAPDYPVECSISINKVESEDILTHLKQDMTSLESLVDGAEEKHRAGKMKDLLRLIDSNVLETTNKLQTAIDGITELIKLYESFSNQRVPDTMHDYLYQAQGCVDLNKVEFMEYNSCHFTPTEMICFFNLMELKEGKAAYTAYEIPYYSNETKSVVTLKKNFDAVNSDLSLVLDFRRCKPVFGNDLLCHNSDWEQDSCLSDIRDKSAKASETCRFQDFPPRSPLLIHLEKGLLIAPRSSKELEINWTHVNGEITNHTLSEPKLFVGMGEFVVSYDKIIIRQRGRETSLNNATVKNEILTPLFNVSELIEIVEESEPFILSLTEEEFELIQSIVAIASLIITTCTLPCCATACYKAFKEKRKPKPKRKRAEVKQIELEEQGRHEAMEKLISTYPSASTGTRSKRSKSK